MNPSYSIIIALGGLIIMGLMNFWMFKLKVRDDAIKEGERNKVIADAHIAVRDLTNRVVLMELKFAALTGKINGGDYRHKGGA